MLIDEWEHMSVCMCVKNGDSDGSDRRVLLELSTALCQSVSFQVMLVCDVTKTNQYTFMCSINSSKIRYVM